MALIYIVTAAPVFVFVHDAALVLLIAIVSWETAISTHLGAWAAEDAAAPSRWQRLIGRFTGRRPD